ARLPDLRRDWQGDRVQQREAASAARRDLPRARVRPDLAPVSDLRFEPGGQEAGRGADKVRQWGTGDGIIRLITGTVFNRDQHSAANVAAAKMAILIFIDQNRRVERVSPSIVSTTRSIRLGQVQT